jgi:hypothetical protein
VTEAETRPEEAIVEEEGSIRSFIDWQITLS